VDKNDDPLPEPVKFIDHALDAIRYAIFTHIKAAAMYIGMTSKSVYPD
jgi:hypothetical protein